MKQKLLFFTCLVCSCFSLSLAQVQLLEHNENAFSPRVGFVYEPSIMQWLLGAEYTIEGNFTLGCNYSSSKFLADTLFKHVRDVNPRLASKIGVAPYANEVKPESFVVNPYMFMEIIEPDKVFPLSFAIKLSWAYLSGDALLVPVDHRDSLLIFGNTTWRDTIDNPESHKYHHHDISLGGQVGARFFLATFSSLIFSGGYDFHYVFKEKGGFIKTLEPNSTEEMWHDGVFETAYLHGLSELLGISAGAKLTVRVQEDGTPMIFAVLNSGLVLKF